MFEHVWAYLELIVDQINAESLLLMSPVQEKVSSVVDKGKGSKVVGLP